MNQLSSTTSLGDYKVLSSSVQVAQNDVAMDSDNTVSTGDYDNKVAIVGGVIGGVVALILIVVSIVYCCKRRAHPTETYNEESIDRKEQAHALAQAQAQQQQQYQYQYGHGQVQGQGYEMGNVHTAGHGISANNFNEGYDI